MLALAALAISAPVRAADTPLPDSKARPDSIVFAGVPWRAAADDAAKRLAAHGFSEHRAARTREQLVAEGRLFDAFAMVHGRLDEHAQVVAWDITIPSKGERNEYAIQRKIYDDMVTEMLEKYGRRQQNVEKYKFPYSKGGEELARGVRESYVTIYSEWKSKNGDRLQLAIGTDMSVVLVYESRWWKEVDAERRKKKAKNL